ncbi:MAG: methyltransferase domain-containing protein [Fulvivirga sp.]
MGKTYQSKFYSSRHGNTIYSAETIVKIVNNLVHPQSVVDVGCGVGTWLKVFEKSGATDILGIEGHWVNEEEIVIAKEQFKKANLEQKVSVPRKFDLAISLEVAEHINEPYADQFVENLVNLAPVILFSAAIPLQGGKHHVNEQWPDYWQEKFLKHNYVILDCIRPQIWHDSKIEMWYAQNTFIYISKEKLDQYQELKKSYVETPSMLSVVHPRFYEFKLNALPIMKAVRNKIKRTFNK